MPLSGKGADLNQGLLLDDGLYLDLDPHVNDSGRVRSESCLCLERGS